MCTIIVFGSLLVISIFSLWMVFGPFGMLGALFGTFLVVFFAFVCAAVIEGVFDAELDSDAAPDPE